MVFALDDELGIRYGRSWADFVLLTVLNEFNDNHLMAFADVKDRPVLKSAIPLTRNARSPAAMSAAA